ncbi:MAG: hypothetical protein RIA63_08030, partial [Cyclobacteriaceae bacterium]
RTLILQYAYLHAWVCEHSSSGMLTYMSGYTNTHPWVCSPTCSGMRTRILGYAYLHARVREHSSLGMLTYMFWVWVPFCTSPLPLSKGEG